MKPNEIREFKLDENKPNCKLTSKEVKIKKMVERERFTLEEDINGEGYIDCANGFVANLKVTGDPLDCGIGKILMKLCLNEETKHNVIDNNKNTALYKLKTYATKNPIFENAKAMEEWAKSKCENLIGLGMVSFPKTKAHLYFNSAIESGYTEMFIALKTEFYPRTGACPVRILKERYRIDGYMIEKGDSDDEKVKVWGNFWYFCKPKSQPIEAKCTELK